MANIPKVISIKNAGEIEVMQQANTIVADVLSLLERKIQPGISTYLMDKWAEEYCRDQGSEPAFKGYHGFPASLCVSINEQVVHGIPSKKNVVKEGDIISLDFGTRYKGFYGDSAITIPVGPISSLKRSLLDVTQLALEKGIEQVQIGKRISDISQAVQRCCEKHGFTVVRQFVGHGIGSELHEAPEVPNFVQKGSSPRILEGMVLAIEPMINAGTGNVRILNDGWTVVTRDNKPSAHFEHSVAATISGPLVLSRRRNEF